MLVYLCVQANECVCILLFTLHGGYLRACGRGAALEVAARGRGVGLEVLLREVPTHRPNGVTLGGLL